jgi:hypothetical protein
VLKIGSKKLLSSQKPRISLDQQISKIINNFNMYLVFGRHGPKLSKTPENRPIQAEVCSKLVQANEGDRLETPH